MKNVPKYYSLIKHDNEADLNIFGDITSWAWEEFGEVSAYTLSKQLEELNDVDTINVHINSYGGEVAEGLAIYNSLRNHKAKVRTFCDGFACSIASVIFMAGDERIMSKASLLMIHNAWVWASGNAKELRKQADDLDVITKASINAYMENVNITEEELKELMDNESWLDYEKAIEMGFATAISKENADKNPSQSVKQKLFNLIMQSQQAETDEDEDENDDSSKTSNDDDVDDDKKTSTEDENEDDENKDDSEEDEKANEKFVQFLNSILGGM